MGFLEKFNKKRKKIKKSAELHIKGKVSIKQKILQQCSKDKRCFFFWVKFVTMTLSE